MRASNTQNAIQPSHSSSSTSSIHSTPSHSDPDISKFEWSNQAREFFTKYCDSDWNSNANSEPELRHDIHQATLNCEAIQYATYRPGPKLVLIGRKGKREKDARDEFRCLLAAPPFNIDVLDSELGFEEYKESKFCFDKRYPPKPDKLQEQWFSLDEDF